MSGLRYARAVLRQARFETAALAIAALLAVGILAALGLVVSSSALRDCGTEVVPSERCTSGLDTAILAAVAGMAVEAGSAIAIAFLSLVLGVGLVAREVEQRTALLAWTLAPSRRRWYAERALVLGLAALAAAAIVGGASDTFQSVADPFVPLGRSLQMYPVRGWMVPALALAAFGSGALWGAVAGRSLPGLILGLAVGAALVGGVMEANLDAARHDLAPVEGDRGGLSLGALWRDAETGRLVTWDEAQASVPWDAPDGAAFDARFAYVDAGLPGSRSLPFIAANALGLAAAGLGSLALGAIATGRRRPS